MPKQETALTVIPKNELALTVQQAEAKARRADKKEHKGDLIFFSGLGVGLVGVGLIGGALALPVLLPVGVAVSTVGLVAEAGGCVVSVVHRNRARKAYAQAAAALEQRSDRLRLAAESVASQRVLDGLELGQEIRVDSEGETPKILRIEQSALPEPGDKNPARRIFSGSLYEGVPQADGSLTLGKKVEWMGAPVQVDAMARPALPVPQEPEPKCLPPYVAPTPPKGYKI